MVFIPIKVTKLSICFTVLIPTSCVVILIVLYCICFYSDVFEETQTQVEN